MDRAQATRLALLAALRETGSISAAARSVGLSYKGAWQILDTLNRQSAAPLFIRSTGGTGGGGTLLTEHGEALLNASTMVSRLAETLSDALSGAAPGFSPLARLGLKTSARNQFSGRISRIEHGAVNDTVTLMLDGGIPLLATVTSDSCRSMDLHPGGEALALFKAGWVLLASETAAAEIAIANRLHGHVSRIEHGQVNSEVIIDLPGGGSVCAIQDRSSLSALQLSPGDRVCALISPAHIILATLA